MALTSINQDDLRNHNLSVVLNTLLRSPQPMSRADLAKRTGLTKATMSLLVPMLVKARAVKEGAPASYATHGRPSTPLSISGERFCGLGLQVNTDGFGVIVLGVDGSVVCERWVAEAMGGSDPDEVFGRLDGLALEAERVVGERGLEIAGTGLALPGLVTDDEQLLSARNLGWRRIDIKRFPLVSRLNVKAGNEANMAGLAQIPGYATQRRDDGIVAPSDSFLYVSTDIGIGGALVRRGRVESGDHGFAGELGHVSVSLDGPLCACGRHGCLEAYAGRQALVESAGVASNEGATRIEAVDELLARWNAGDKRTVEAVDRAIRALGSAISSAINILDIDTVILGGILERFGQELASRLQDELESQILSYPKVRPRVLLSDVNGRPALLGAAQVGLRQFIDVPLPFIEE
ncbi:Sugar kinase of the NBD/HSP70 family, may contain an N-terminal HTH domain [Bifidobacterium bohemicum]|uniref:ROK family protein n=1 Tax=Bifidobacterium bohemicum DSM 22767 TaxID=1437606 RepID=A0A086ZGD0_9BIFI|nr:ROK family protein [Bifidobacterium bohemicum]KFI45580.1 ROK family protein [Bifidobacterium bohemicum DSM 22767]SCC01471.1 Sugar kinase of the NBD/HSP70 family, may contain an N-terminal HTH domain [Bifidobacterium bohemicum]